jgi:predicted dehydrogenase
VKAVASSSSKAKAEKFINDFNVPAGVVAYGSYEELVKDPYVNIIYVATPHSHHFQNTMLALEAGKHVLCEKAFTVNAAQAKILCETAKKKNLFLMEAVWTRYFPLSIQVRELIQKGEIGEVLRVVADNSFGEDVETKWGTEHRMVNKNLAGGALLDCKISLRPITCLTVNSFSTRIWCADSEISGNLFIDLGLPDPIPYSPPGTTQATVSSIVPYDRLSPHRG